MEANIACPRLRSRMWKDTEFGQADALSRLITLRPFHTEDVVIARIEEDTRAIQSAAWPEVLEMSSSSTTAIQRELMLLYDSDIPE
ncbi:unnamed protein product [Strongylus vulgaris]|uniref:Uncharacterized protein n=1 Tax=Strongylus vulgaris TaxID=40348 RepID=A0A3P7IIW3_STRVU|nr:unnamed protein product [Strongylus vulgaris]